MITTIPPKVVFLPTVENCNFVKLPAFSNWVATGQEMVREKILEGQGKVREIDNLKKSGNIEKIISADLIPLKAKRNI